MLLRALNHIDSSDCAGWLRMRYALWPDCPEERHHLEMRGIASSSSENAVLVIDRGDGILGGFIEVSVRATVDGAHSERTAYVEG